MCQTADNSLEANLEAQGRMLLNVVVTLDRMPTLILQAENAERVYKTLMKDKGWSPEQLLEITGYRVLASQNQFAI